MNEKKERLIPPHVTGNNVLVHPIIIKKQHQGVRQGIEFCSIEHKLRIRAILIAAGLASVNKKLCPACTRSAANEKSLRRRQDRNRHEGDRHKPGRIGELFLQKAARGILIDDQDIDETALQCAINGLKLFRTVGDKYFMPDHFQLV